MAPGVAEAAAAHIHAVAARIRLVNQQLKTAYCQLDQLCDRLVPPEDNMLGQRCEQHEMAILRSMDLCPASDGSSSRCCSARVKPVG
jgi:hypothetical protein